MIGPVAPKAYNFSCYLTCKFCSFYHATVSNLHLQFTKENHLFPPEEMLCTSTLYHEVWAGNLPLHIMDLPDALKRKKRKANFSHRNKKHYGTSIEQRPAVVNERTEVGHWEVDTVVGKCTGREAVVLSLLEKKTQHYITRLIPGKTSQAVMSGMKQLREEYGDAFSQVFKTLTVDNGSEFADLSQVEGWGSRVYFAHPYAAWERGQNERHNGLFRAYVQKGQSMACYGEEDILTRDDIFPKLR